MKTSLFNVFIIFLSIFVLCMLMLEKDLIYSSTNYGLNIWVNNLIPTLFPFFIISDILINYKVVDYIPRFFKNIFKKIFNITDNMFVIFILSMISGFPSNARNTRTMYDNGMIDINEANHIMIFSHFSNPLFILTTIGLFFFNYKKIGVILLITHYLSNIILGFLIRNKFIHYETKKNDNEIKNSFGKIFIDSIKKAVDNILLICGIVCIFMILSSIIEILVLYNSSKALISLIF